MGGRVGEREREREREAAGDGEGGRNEGKCWLLIKTVPSRKVRMAIGEKDPKRERTFEPPEEKRKKEKRKK